MANFFPALEPKHREFIENQKLFFVATAPESGRINLSPMGLDTLRVVDPKRVIYLDLTGSGNETSAHLRQNGRMTVMFHAFEGNPLILRLYGTGSVISRTDPTWDANLALFPEHPSPRQIIALDIESVQTSCGFGIPLYEYRGDRSTLVDWAEQKGPEGVEQYWRKKNLETIDGLATGFEW